MTDLTIPVPAEAATTETPAAALSPLAALLTLVVDYGEAQSAAADEVHDSAEEQIHTRRADALYEEIRVRAEALAVAERAHVAADRRVLDAAEAWSRQWGPDAKELSVVYYEPGTRELFAAALARRALGHTAPGEAPLTHNEGTLRKVYDALSRAGLTETQSIDAINDMQNNGLYFREAGHPAPGEWVADHQPERHGYTIHGHPCCNQASPETPAAIAKCGGPGMCRVCKEHREELHGSGEGQEAGA